MRYLVTGGAGFIGSHLCERLLDDGHEVTAFDDLSSGSADNVAPLRKRPGFALDVGTILDAPRVAALVDRHDAVVHLAASVGVFQAVDDPLRVVRVNVLGSEIVLRRAAKRGRPLLLASTSEVYGKSTKLPFAEDDDAVMGPTSKGRWAYADSKRLDEVLALSLGGPAVVARLFNTVGPRQSARYGMVLPRFVRQALEGRALTVFGDGRQTRCFAWVGEVVEALVRLMKEPRALGQVVNVGHDEEISIDALARLVRDAVNPALPVELVPYEKAYGKGFEDTPRRVPDLRKLQSLVGCRPSLGVREIVGRLVALGRS